MSTSTRALALVSGAGIGPEIARLLARDGYDVVATGRSDAISAAAIQLRAEGAVVYPVQADLARREGVEAVWQAVLDTGRPLEVAVLNAGRSIGGAFTDTDLDDQLAMIALNVTSVVHLAKRVTRHMVQRLTAGSSSPRRCP